MDYFKNGTMRVLKKRSVHIKVENCAYITDVERYNTLCCYKTIFYHFLRSGMGGFMEHLFAFHSQLKLIEQAS